MFSRTCRSPVSALGSLDSDLGHTTLWTCWRGGLKNAFDELSSRSCFGHAAELKKIGGYREVTCQFHSAPKYVLVADLSGAHNQLSAFRLELARIFYSLTPLEYPVKRCFMAY